MMNLNKEYFTEEEILKDLSETVSYMIEEGGSADTEQMFNDTFNADYYIIGTYEAKQALTQYGVFEALKQVTDRQMELVGEVTSEFIKELTDPEKLANILYYTKAEELCEQLGLYEEEELNHEQLKELKHEIEKELSRLVIF